MDPDRDIELLGNVPHDVVVAGRERAAATGVGADEPADEAELRHRPPQLPGRGGRVLQWQHRCPEEPPRVSGAVGGHPVVIGGGQRGRGGGIIDDGEVQPDRGVQDGLVDALGIHVAQPRHRIPPAGERLGQRSEGRGVVERGAGAGQVPQRHGQDLGVSDHHVLVARPVRADPGPDVLGKSLPGLHRLDDVAVGVDHGPGARRERCRFPRRAGHGAGVRQSSTGGSGWRNSRLALAPATARSSPSGSAPHVSARTRWVSGHDESAWG